MQIVSPTAIHWRSTVVNASFPPIMCTAASNGPCRPIKRASVYSNVSQSYLRISVRELRLWLVYSCLFGLFPPNVCILARFQGIQRAKNAALSLQSSLIYKHAYVVDRLKNIERGIRLSFFQTTILVEFIKRCA